MPAGYASHITPWNLYSRFVKFFQQRDGYTNTQTARNVDQYPTWWPPCRILVVPSVQRRKVWLTPNTRVPCSNAAKTRNPMKFAGLPQTRQRISAVSGSKFTSGGQVFSFVWYMPSLWRYNRTKLYDGAQMSIFASFLHPVFSASRVHQASDVHSKFALRPRHVCKYGIHPISDRWD